MKKFINLFFFTFLGNLIFAQETINFENGFPQNSHFKIISKTDNSGTMKITGTPAAIASIKKAGYNQNRKITSKIEVVMDVKTETKTSESIPFEFYYDKVGIYINSDGKEKNRDFSLADKVIKGSIKNGKYIISDVEKSGNPVNDEYINSLQKTFLKDITEIKNMKIGDSFTTKKEIQSTTDNYKLYAVFTYNLSKIENNLGFYDVKINLINDKNSVLKATGSGTGKMVYDALNKYIKSEESKITVNAIQTEKDFKILADTTINSSYLLTFGE